MNNLSVRDVTELLEEKSLKVAEKTVYGWESSATQPDADTLLLLCDIYNIDNILALSDILTKSQLILQNMNIT